MLENAACLTRYCRCKGSLKASLFNVDSSLVQALLLVSGVGLIKSDCFSIPPCQKIVDCKSLVISYLLSYITI